jgi:preprotein translocase subunit SecF
MVRTILRGEKWRQAKQVINMAINKTVRRVRFVRRRRRARANA